MSLLNKTEIVKKIHEDWGDTPQLTICIGVLEYIDNYPEGKINRLSYGSLRNIVGVTIGDEPLLMSVQYLCGDRMNILAPRFELIDEDDIFLLTNSEVNSARKTGLLIHPELGDPVVDFEDNIYIFFEPGAAFRRED